MARQLILNAGVDMGRRTYGEWMSKVQKSVDKFELGGGAPGTIMKIRVFESCFRCVEKHGLVEPC